MVAPTALAASALVMPRLPLFTAAVEALIMRFVPEPDGLVGAPAVPMRKLTGTKAWIAWEAAHTINTTVRLRNSSLMVVLCSAVSVSLLLAPSVLLARFQGLLRRFGGSVD